MDELNRPLDELIGDGPRFPVAAEAVAAMRILLEQGDTETYRKRRDELLDTGFAGHWAVLLVTMLALMVRARFGLDWRGGQVVRWVGQARARPGSDPADLDPIATERLIRTMLGDVGDGESLDAVEAIAERQTPATLEILTVALVDEFENLGQGPNPEIDQLVADSVEWSERLLSLEGSLDRVKSAWVEARRRGQGG